MQKRQQQLLKESLSRRAQVDEAAKALAASGSGNAQCKTAKTSEECKMKGQSCEWAPTPFLGRLFSRYGTCRDVPIFELYVRAVCADDLEAYEGPELYKNELKRISTRFGYTIEDFGAPKGGWKDVTRKQICERVKKDVIRASEIVAASSSSLSRRQGGVDEESIKKALNMEGRDVVFERLIRYATYRTLKSDGNFYETIDYVSKFLKENKRFVIVNLFAICFIVYGVYENYSYFSSLKFSPYTGRGGEGGLSSSLSNVNFEGFVRLSDSAEIGEYRSSILDFYRGRNQSGMVDVVPLIEYADLNKQEGCVLLLGDLNQKQEQETDMFTSAAAAEKQQRRRPEKFEDYEAVCKLGIENESLFVEDTISEIMRHDSDDLSNREDFKEWGLLPGQPIFYRGAFGTQRLAHYGVYVGKGIIAEVGMGPSACGKTMEIKSSFLTRSKAQSTGLSTLEDFVSRAGGRTENVIFISSPEDSSKEKAIERLKKIPQFIGEFSYNPVTNNCEGFANAVAFGTNVATGSVQARTALLLATFVIIVSDTAIQVIKNKWKASRIRSF